MLLFVTWAKAAELLGKPEDEVRQLAHALQWNYTLAGVEIRVERHPKIRRKRAA